MLHSTPRGSWWLDGLCRGPTTSSRTAHFPRPGAPRSVDDRVGLRERAGGRAKQRARTLEDELAGDPLWARAEHRDRDDHAMTGASATRAASRPLQRRRSRSGRTARHSERGRCGLSVPDLRAGDSSQPGELHERDDARRTGSNRSDVPAGMSNLKPVAAARSSRRAALTSATWKCEPTWIGPRRC